MPVSKIIIPMKRAYIEITNRCNLSCAFCMKHSRPYKDMSLQEFEHVVKEVKHYTDFLYFHVQGEPLLHKNMDELFDITDKENCHVQLVTNGSLLKNHMDLYKHSSLRKVSFSLQSIEYQANTEAIPFLETILAFCKNASEYGKFCEIRFWRDDQADMPKTKACMDYLEQHFTLDETNRKNSLKLMERVYLSYNNSFSWPDISETKETHEGTCHGGIDQIAILSDGTVVPCCLDCQGNIPLGNIFETPLKEILQSERYLNLIKGFRNHKITEPLCQKCTYRLRFSHR